ncbi:DUF3822 family protein [Psychroserpens damuponensis]|uniref:DUF3822 family protein n=1 Tax=Psychroserpens damuponensis TaxID=943936 RepID=UPI00058F7C25|nr:DUF3822 family protein [Psychroserpens damuponensis]
MAQNSIKALSIQIRLSGLSFCILNRTSNVIEFIKHVLLEKKATPYELLNDLKNTIASHTEFQQPFDSVTCIYQNELSCLVPNELFDENNMADYLKFNAKILKTDFISFDHLVAAKSANVYVPLININNYIFETFGSFDYKHASSIMIETFLQQALQSSETTFCINVNDATFEIICTENKRLLFYNTFEYATKEDFIYYVLFTIEQLKLNPETIKISLTGNIKVDDSLYTILYKYIRFVEFLQPNYNFDFQTELETHHSNFILLNSFN